MPIHLDPSITRTDQALVVEIHEDLALAEANPSGALGARTVTIRPSTRLESFANSLRNFFSFGLYSRLLGNPSQWKKLRMHLLHDAQQSNSGVSQAALQRLFLTYSDSGKLTTAKLNNILSDYERAKNDPNWQPQLNPQFSEADQNLAAVMARSIQQLARKLTPEEQALKDLASARVTEYAEAQQEFETYLHTEARGGETHRYRGVRREAERPAVISELGNGIYAAKAMQHILRPGRTLQSDDLSYFMAALQREVKAANQYVPNGDPSQKTNYQFGYKVTNWPTQPVAEVFAEARGLYRQHMNAIGSETGLYAIPLVLEGKGPLENHVILIAIDADRKQINILDSKGYSLENLESSYRNAPGLKQSLEGLGKSLFGDGWDARQNVLQMNIPKQLGANDCGAFVCDFTRQLLNGKSVGDIERTFDAKQRSELRMQAARTIKEGFLDNLDEDVRFLRDAAKENVDMQVLVRRYEPTFEALQKPDPLSQLLP
jgi:hypothetical protein